MPKHSRRFAAEKEKIEREKYYALDEALALVRSSASAKFDESLEIHIKLGVDPSKGDQAVRGSIVLPHGTGKVPRVAVFAEGDAAEAATAAGADRVGGEDLVSAIDEGWMEFDVLVAHPSMMRFVGRLGKKLGPRMPSKKAGNITDNVGEAVGELKAGKVEYRVDRGAVVHVSLGKMSFTDEQLLENLSALMKALVAARPSSATGRYIRNISICSTMGPGVKVDPATAMPKAA